MLKAIITGIYGQDGSYLCELLLSKGYRVYGVCKNNILKKNIDCSFFEHSNFSIVECDISVYEDVYFLINEIKPDEIYNFAAYSFVADSDNNPLLLHKVTASAPINFAEAIRCGNKKIKLFQASSSEIFGDSYVSPQTENVALLPRNAYGIAKAYAHQMLQQYRDSHGLYIVIGILYNHESPLRDSKFVTRKITSTVANIFLGKNEVLELGNLDSVRDWGYAKEYVEGIWLSMQLNKSNSFILSTGKETSVRDFVNLSFNSVGISIYWKGDGINEVGCNSVGKVLVKVNNAYYRHNEKLSLIGDPSKAKQMLGWSAKTTLKELCELMVNYDIDLLSKVD